MKNINYAKQNQLEAKIHESVTELDRDEFSSIQPEDNPFFEYGFLFALEKSGSVGRGSGWDPRIIALYDKGVLIASLVFYIKTDSYGEYIFDWEWARAYYNAGLEYYPKAVVGIPFTPANGDRILVSKDYDFRTCATLLIEKLMEFCRDYGLSSVHLLFVTERERNLLERLGFLTRITHQYHWHNRDYENFDDFLGDLRSGRRKQIRKERKRLYSTGIEVSLVSGDELDDRHMEAVWQFYLNTNSRKWGNAYLNRKFFELIFRHFRERTLLVLAGPDQQWYGGTINFYKNKKLYGRYWGALNDVEYLHFECCYYRLIEYAINNRMDIFEAGAQGEHKFLRGFSAVPIYSSHYFYNKGAHNSISDFLEREKIYSRNLIKNYNKQSPLKHLYGR